MKWTVVGLMVLGLVAACCAVVLVNTLREDAALRAGVSHQAPEQIREVDIVVAAKPIAPVTQLEASQLRMTTVPTDQAPKDYFADRALVVGRVVKIPLAEGQVLTPEHLVAKGSYREFPPVLPEGMRAVSITLPSHSGLGGILFPGCIVDVLVSLKLPAIGTKRSDIVATTLLDRIHVLAVENETIISAENDDRLGPGRQRVGHNRMITLLVDTKQALTLGLAMEHGTVSLAMRNPLDDTPGIFEEVLLTQLSPEYAARLAVEAKADEQGKAQEEAKDGPQLAQAAPGPLDWEVVVIRGAEMEKRSIPAPTARAAQTRIGKVGKSLAEVGSE
jgi:pilus assembly protein CpaB